MSISSRVRSSRLSTNLTKLLLVPPSSYILSRRDLTSPQVCTHLTFALVYRCVVDLRHICEFSSVVPFMSRQSFAPALFSPFRLNPSWVNPPFARVKLIASRTHMSTRSSQRHPPASRLRDGQRQINFYLAMPSFAALCFVVLSIRDSSY